MALDQELRRTGFTSTDIPALFGCDEHRDAHSVVAAKAFGQIEGPQEYYEKGKYLEPGVVNWYSAKTGRTVEALFDKTFRHPRHPHVLASPDGLVVGESRGVDAKVASFSQRHQWGDTCDDIPTRVQIQMAICMEVLDRNYWDVALFSEDRLRIIEIPRDREFGEFLCVEAEKMWEQYVERREWPPIGSSKISAAWLQKMYPNHKSPDLRPATDAEVALLNQYGKLRGEIKTLSVKQVELENKLKEAVADREGLEWPHGKFTWRKTKDSAKVDWQSMAIALRTHFIKDEDPRKEAEARQKVTLDHTRPKPGSRRIHFRSDGFVEEEEADAA